MGLKTVFAVAAVAASSATKQDFHSATASLLKIKEAVKHMREHRGVINNEI
jgi:hypothetical protein